MKTSIKMKCFIVGFAYTVIQMLSVQVFAQSSPRKKKIVAVSFARTPSSPMPKKKITPKVQSKKHNDQNKMVITDTPYGSPTTESDLEPIRSTVASLKNKGRLSKTTTVKKIDQSFYEPIDDSKFDQ